MTEEIATYPAMNSDLAAAFAAIVGEKYALTEKSDTEPFATELRGLYGGETPLVLRPANTEEVSKIMALANEHDIPVVPQGGNTGLVGAQTPSKSNSQIVLSLGRLNSVRSVDPLGNTMVVEAGCILQNLQELADEAGLLFPLSLGAQGSCQIGGNISSNAGGTGVLAYGNTRELVMGLEVVLADGRIWHGLNELKKNNTGYDLKHLFIAGEGTLGIITAAVLKLFPKPKGTAVALLAVENPETALSVFVDMRSRCGASLTAFELIERRPLEFLYRHFEQHSDPLENVHPWYCLIEVSSQKSEADANTMLMEGLEQGFESGLIPDAAIANNLAQQKEFWLMRENTSWAQAHEGVSIKHDISVPIHSIPNFIELAGAAVAKIIPDIRPVCFGHMGDGNLHYNLTQPADMDGPDFRSQAQDLHEAVYEIVLKLNGSISAEHGIGVMKRDNLAHIKKGPEMDMMLAIKDALDPKNLLNPGKLLSVRPKNAD